MSESTAGVAVSQLVPAEAGNRPVRGQSNASDPLSDKGFAEVLPVQIDLVENQSAALLSPVGFLQMLQQPGNTLPPLAAAGSQILPDDRTRHAPGQQRIIASLSLDTADKSLDADGDIRLFTSHEGNTARAPGQLLSPDIRNAAVETGSRLAPAIQEAATQKQNQLMEIDFNPLVNAKLTETSELPETTIKLTPDAAGSQATERAAVQYSLSQSVVTAQESVAGQSKASVHLGPRINHQDWGAAMAARVNWQAGEKIQIAEFSINPPELGKVEVKISVENDRASVQFNVQSGLVKEAVEEALPRLRELMAQSGMTLADSNVSQQSKEQGTEAQQTEQGHNSRLANAEEDSEASELTSSMVDVSVGLVDHYI